LEQDAKPQYSFKDSPKEPRRFQSLRDLPLFYARYKIITCKYDDMAYVPTPYPWNHKSSEEHVRSDTLGKVRRGLP